MVGERTDRRIEMVNVVLAVCGNDRAALTQLLQTVASVKDRHRRDTIATILGKSAALVDEATYHMVLEVWRETIDYAPKYFALAWQAYRSQAPQQALLAAEFITARYPDDLTFAAEADFIRAIIAAEAEATD